MIAETVDAYEAKEQVEVARYFQVGAIEPMLVEIFFTAIEGGVCRHDAQAKAIGMEDRRGEISYNFLRLFFFHQCHISKQAIGIGMF